MRLGTRELFPLKLYLAHLPNALLAGLAFLLNCATWGRILLELPPREESFFLHYNILFGVDYIGAWGNVLYLPSAGLLIFLLNLFLGWAVFREERFAAYLLLAIAALCNAGIFIAATLLILLNV
ncbi:MAG: hypothetical protein AAB932_06005 [Patescibacteria group bacterium]